ncbi:hypothetical protein AOX59_13915 [Lentibacillus amyloliquefaciens]|uniref:Uncharacterized protein n=1 Tax=Lentibacillus amyloliquefaciens TaxID=1472767 RepID=A0A0U4E8F8_9BACI|nr:hypothetical protein AOX59_13915 [Lentibacillus amyloliquefaciens]
MRIQGPKGAVSSTEKLQGKAYFFSKERRNKPTRNTDVSFLPDFLNNLFKQVIPKVIHICTNVRSYFGAELMFHTRFGCYLQFIHSLWIRFEKNKAILS